MIGAVLFDVDGTLVDSNDLHASAWQAAFRHFGIDLPFDRIRAQIGKGGDNLIPALLPPQVVREKQKAIEDYRSELFRTDYLPRVAPFPGVRRLFERLYEDGVKIVLASSSHSEEVAFHLNLIGAADLVHATTSRDDVEHSKPCPDIFAAAMGKVAPLGPDALLVVGDTPYDVRAAARLGIGTVALRCGGFPEAELVAAGAAAIHEDPAELCALYPRWLEPASRLPLDGAAES